MADYLKNILLKKLFSITTLIISVGYLFLFLILFLQNQKIKKLSENTIESTSKLPDNLSVESSTGCSLACQQNINNDVARFYKNQFNIYPHFKYLVIDGNKNYKDLSNLYTSKWFWCGGSSGERLLPSEYQQHLIPVGKLNHQQDVYSLSAETPLPQNNYYFFTTDKQFGGRQLIENLNSSKFDENTLKWQKFLEDQEELNYPMLIIKENNKFLVYIRIDYLFRPGC